MKIDYSNISKTYDNYRSYAYSEIRQLIRFGKLENGMKILDLVVELGIYPFNY